MNLNDWLTVPQCRKRAEVSSQAIHQLANRGTLASMFVGKTRLIGRNSFNDWLAGRLANPRTRGAVKNIDPKDTYTPDELQAAGQLVMFDSPPKPAYDGDEEWTGTAPPTLSVEARRLYDESPRGQRELRLRSTAAVEGGE